MEKLHEIILKSHNRLEVLKNLGWDTNTTGYRKLNKLITQDKIDISHFETSKERYSRIQPNRFKIVDLKLILVTGSTFSRTHLKRKLFKAGLKARHCEMCGQDEIWQGKIMGLILDHKNGIHDDNRLENLRIICPNCNATLDTHCGKNKKHKKGKIKKVGYTFKTYEKNQKLKRKVDRPIYETLKSEIKSLGFTGTGAKYNVSDNTIRKWVKHYEKFISIYS